MSRTIHRFYSIPTTIIFKNEHILFILFIMTRSFPELKIENVWSDNFLISSHFILISNKVLQFVVNNCSFIGKEN